MMLGFGILSIAHVNSKKWNYQYHLVRWHFPSDDYNTYNLSNIKNWSNKLIILHPHYSFFNATNLDQTAENKNVRYKNSVSGALVFCY